MKRISGVTSFIVLTACGVSATSGGTGGVDAGAADAGGACPAAVVVTDSDFMSTNISVVSPTGTVLKQSILQSGSTPPGLTSALSGDVVLPLGRTPGEIVLIDRANAVLTWQNPGSGAVEHQMPVGTGFASNPYDYLELSPTKAYVTRYETNLKAGMQPNDGGGDVLVIDPQTVSIEGRVPFATEGAFLPRPDRMMHVGGDVWVTLDRLSADFTTAGDARVVGVTAATDSIAWTLDLAGVANCGGMAMAPSGKIVALSCSGLSSDTNPQQRSALVLLDATVRPPVEIKRFSAAMQLGQVLGSTLAFGSEELLVGVALGDMPANKNDLVYSLVLASGTAHVAADSGMPFALGDVRCTPGCTSLCFVADANEKALRVWKVDGTTLTPETSVQVDTTLGLPPRALGSY
ncbi:MAG: hypothetical protein L3K06_07005 [Thermoplasmata archaeon]|nr:hypothetical protein [Thermoplasmata archaeon]